MLMLLGVKAKKECRCKYLLAKVLAGQNSLMVTTLVIEFKCFQCHCHRVIKSRTEPCSLPLQARVKEWVVLKNSLNLSVVP